ncbi:LysE family translocator [Humidesulfovibrio idahonensis]
MSAILNFPAFLLAALALCAMPGPDCMYVIGRTMAQGRRAGVVSALGITAGASVHVLAAALGLSAFLAASAEAFLVLKYIGAAYLIYLGVQSFRNTGSLAATAARTVVKRQDRTLFLQGVLTDVLNPKVALFFLAFLPQFISPQAQDKVGAFLGLGAIVLVMGLLWDVGLAFCAGRIMRRLRGNSSFERAANRVLGGVLVSLGLALACEDR